MLLNGVTALSTRNCAGLFCRDTGHHRELSSANMENGVVRIQLLDLRITFQMTLILTSTLFRVALEYGQSR
jgi:hypothetical protein